MNICKSLLALVLLCQTLPVIAAPFSAERKAELSTMLVEDCGACHGLNLNGGLGPSLLRSDLLGKPRELLVAAILNGRPGTAMPPWHPLMTHKEAEWLLDQLLAE